MDKFHQELFDVLKRCRSVSKKRESKAASFFATEINKAQVIHNFLFNKH